MYQSFYQLQTNPFSLTPDPKFCYSHSGYMQAREYLDYALKLGEGFVMVTGRPGTGKTTLIESFLATLNMGRVNAVRIAASGFGAEDLLRAVAYAYGLEAEGKDKATLRHLIKQFFEEQLRSGRHALLIIDEAQGLPRPALEELRLLADLQAGSRQLLQLFLVGQEELRAQMSSPEMDHFQQRVIANYHLVPMDLMESRAYMEFRLCQAGWQGNPEITGEAVLDIYRFSRGVPRHINKLCNRLLLLGYAVGSHKLDSREVKTIAAEMDAELLRPIAGNQSDEVAIAETLDIPEITPDLLLNLTISMEEPVLTGAAISAAVVSGEEAQAVAGLASHHVVDLSAAAVKSDLAATPGAVILSDPAVASDHGHQHTALRGFSYDWKKLLTAATGWQEKLVPSVVMLIVAALSISAVMDDSGEEVSQQDAMLTVDLDIPDLLPAYTGEQQVLAASIPADTQQAPAAQVMVTETVFSDAPAPVADDTLLQQVLDDTLPGTAAGFVPEQTAQLAVTDEMPEPPMVHAVQAQNTTEQTPVDEVVAEIASATDMSADNELQADAASGTEIEDLIAQGYQALDDDRLLIPAGDSAYHYFQSTLKLEPRNAEASQGIGKIVEHYVLLANKALAKRERIKADRYIARGLSIKPDNTELLALKEGLQVASDTPDVASLELEDAAASQVEDPRKRTDSFFARVMTFFASHNKPRLEVMAVNENTSSSLYE